MNIELLAWSQGPLVNGTQAQPEEIAEVAGRTCYKSPVKDAEKRATFLRGIIKSGHESVIEHCTATIRITGISRALTHQLVRHRLFSFSQQSQRYVKENEAEYIVPNAIKTNPEACKKFNDLMDKIWTTYRELFDLGIKKEDCRAVLPNAACTEIVVTGNFREWRHFIELRADIHAQTEIRHLAHLIAHKLSEIAPNVFNDQLERYADTDCEV